MNINLGISTSFYLPDGREVIIETGKLAKQADGSVVLKTGNTVILATATSSREAMEKQSFFPLSVDYQEKFSAAGRIPGSFFRREGKLSDYEVLISRLVDRAIRPLFPDNYMNETQVFINLLSADKEIVPDALAALAASAALSVSDIPWNGPISEVRVAKINGELRINPLRSELENATLDLIVAASLDNVMMVEGEANEVQESEIVEAIKFAHEAIKVQVNAQMELARLVGDKALIKRELSDGGEDSELKEEIKSEVEKQIFEIAKGAFSKTDRKSKLKDLEKELIEKFTLSKGEDWIGEKKSQVSNYIDKLKKEVFREVILADNKRLDGRKLDEIRPIWSEVDSLPASHGSAIFTRGETQVLSVLTLGTKMDQIMVDNALDSYYDNFMLHYSFPGFSVGEVKPMRGPGRREIGHGNLAGRSLRKVLPVDFPYTIRITSDVLESNGSSSMATVCSGSMALMDAGVPVKNGVSGIAMGLVTDGSRFAVLSDILGDEDAIGDMDFKVTGTENGIVACQMDIKIDGLPYEILEQALLQAKEGRLHILNEMNKCISNPNEDLKPHAPRIEVLFIETSQIGEVIGPGGKVIQEIQKNTNTTINIDEVDNKGVVHIFSNNKQDIDAAVEAIKNITYIPEVGDVYDAVVKTIMPFGVFVEFLGKRSGLIHVSELSYTRIENVETAVNIGDRFKVKYIGVDPKTKKMRLSRKALMPKPDYIKDDREHRKPQRRDDRPHGERKNYDKQ
ncbi:MAG: polyribonucleotide nucleotidyltransferase [Deltaproteobacteria bacterium]